MAEIKELVQRWREEKRFFSIAQGNDSTEPLYTAGNALALALEHAAERIRSLEKQRRCDCGKLLYPGPCPVCDREDSAGL